MSKKRRFEMVIDADLYASAAKHAKMMGFSVAELIRRLLNRYDCGEIALDPTNEKPIERSDDEYAFYSTASGDLLYRFNLAASSAGLSRIELMQLVMEAINNGRINIDKLKCDCYQ